MLLKYLLLILMLAVQPLSPAWSQASDPSVETITAKLDNLAERQLPEAQQKQVREYLEEALVQLRSAEKSQQALVQLNAQLKTAPATIDKARQELAELKKTVRSDPREQHSQQGLVRLEQLFAEWTSQLEQWQQRHSDASSRLISAQTRPERGQAERATIQARISAIATASKDTTVEEQREALIAEQKVLESRDRLLRKEMASANVLHELAQTERDLASEWIGRLEADIAALQTLISERRREESEKIIDQLWQEVEEGNTNSLLGRENAINSLLSRTLLEATDRFNQIASRNLEVRQQLETLRQSEQALQELVEVLHGSLLLSRILHEQRATLPEVSIDGTLASQIADIRLDQFDLRQQRERLNNPAAHVDQLLEAEPENAPREELRQTLMEVMKTRLTLVDRVNSELNTLLNESINLQLAQKELQTTADSLRASLDEQLFWIPSNRPMDMQWLKNLPGGLQTQVASMPWASVAGEFRTGLISRPLLFLPLILLIAALLWRRPWIAAKLDDIQSHIGFVRRDRQRYTPLALLLTLLSALPGTLLFALTGLALLMDARGQNGSLGTALLQMAQVWLVFYTAYRVLAPRGIAVVHFRWAPALVARRRLLIRNLGLAVLAMAAVVTFAEQQPEALSGDVFGLVVVVSGYALFIWLLPRLLWDRNDNEPLSALRMLGGLLLGLVPVTLIIAVASGYYYTALLLTGRLIDSLFLILLWRLAGAMVERALSLAAQRLAWQRALQQAETEPRENIEGGEVVVEEPSLNVDQVNQQSLRLMRLALLSLFAVALYWVWADLITLFSYLDRIVLYEFASGSGETETLKAISLKNVLAALAIIVIAIILAGNIPGLLEMLVLSRLKLAQGSAYATTTLLSYVIISVGFVATLGTLGLSWDKLQWLVAALSLGLGFGLQEIFANFVSGLILLFERPIRIGDVITVNNISGTVRLIRIRATTMTDFDRKEIIIPNKVFVTGQLTNWSLSDTVTRVIVKVGVAYGSNLDKTRELLMQIASENPRVLKDPAPLVYFLNFGASTLDHELRVHVRELGDRNPAIDEINRRIDELFTENEIEIAFSQLDIHVRDIVTGREQNLYSGPTPPPQGPAV